MITLFTIPKEFSGHNGVIQRNAIESWRRLGPDMEIILCGNDGGVKEAAEAFGVRQIPDIACNEYGTPLLNSAFERVNELARNSLLCYVNADIMLSGDFSRAVARIPFRRFLMVGQRWDVDILDPWDFTPDDWDDKLAAYVTAHGRLHPPVGSDYFVFPRGDRLGKLPPFAVGRAGWDNWVIFRARRLRVPVVDASAVTMVVHQNHGYRHVTGGTNEKSYAGPESDRNLELASGLSSRITLVDATHVVTPEKVRRNFGLKTLKRKWNTLPILFPAAGPIVRPLSHLISLIGSILRRIKKALHLRDVSKSGTKRP